MSDNVPAKIEKTQRGAVTGRLKRAIDAMVWDALPQAKAAESVGMRPHSLYKAMRRPPVMAYYQEEIGVLRAGLRPRNLHVLAEVRDGSRNDMARVAAARALEPPPAQALVNVNIGIRAGYVIDLREADDPLTIEHRP